MLKCDHLHMFAYYVGMVLTNLHISEGPLSLFLLCCSWRDVLAGARACGLHVCVQAVYLDVYVLEGIIFLYIGIQGAVDASDAA